MMRKIYVLVVLAGMLAGVCSGGAFAAYYDEGSDGDSWETAYIIDSAEDFMAMRNNTNNELGKYYKLTTDLDLRAESDFGYAEFHGHFDGQNHTVTVNIQNNGHCGLFGLVGTTSTAIKNLNVTGSVRGGDVSGGIASTLVSGTIENCRFDGTVEDVLIIRDSSTIVATGGIVGSMSSSSNTTAVSLKDCVFHGTVKADGTIRASISSDVEIMSDFAGGLVGMTQDGEIENCTVLEGSSVEASYAAGGIAGYVGMSGSYNNYRLVTISNCTTSASFSGNAQYTGGVAGYCLGSANFSGNSWPSGYPEIGRGSADSDSDVPVPVEPSPTVSADIPEGVVQTISLEPQIIDRIAQTLSVDASQIHILSESNITAPQEPTQAMIDYVKSDGHEITGKLSTISADVQGYYVFKVTLTDELYALVKDKNTSDFKFYALSDESSPQVSASILNGLLGTWEVLSMTGEKLDTFGAREFLMVCMLEASKPLSLYIAKILLMLLAGGCNHGFGILILAGLAALSFRRH